MPRHNVRYLAVLAVALVVGACAGDTPLAPEPTVQGVRGPGSRITAGTCTTKQELDRLAKLVYGNRQPDQSSALAKIKTIDSHVRKGNLANAIAAAHDLADFTLKALRDGRLVAPEETVALFLNSVYCYAGLDVSINVPSNTHLIFPSDAPQVRYAADQQSAVSLQANPVSEPTLLEFEQIEDTYPDGDGILDTKLDQYPGFLVITTTSEHNSGLTQPAVVGICADGVIPQEVRDRLLLGHGTSTGFEIAPAADASFLNCENLTASAEQSIGAKLIDRLASLVLPQKLHARTKMRAGGGVGGTVTEFSPFAPVDPELKAGGGVGGTVTEFISAGIMESPFAGTASLVDACDPITGVTGFPVRDACRPHLTITTNLGTVLTSVPVTWSADVGGEVAPLNGSCGSYAPSLIVPTDLFGTSSICWKLGAKGANTVTATPSAGGDAPAGVVFTPASVTFNATAAGLPAAVLPIAGDNQVSTPGATLPIAPRVRVVDEDGTPLPNYLVSFMILYGGGSVNPVSAYTDVNGYASTVWTIGSRDQEMKAWVWVNESTNTFIGHLFRADAPIF